MWAFILLCAITLIGLYLYNPQKVKHKFYESTKSNTNYVFVTLYFIIIIIVVIIFAMLAFDNIGDVVSKLNM